MRHGQTYGNVAGALDTALPGLELTDLGQAQARAAARALADRGVEQVVVSTRVRTHQTAAPTAQVQELSPVELPGIHEIGAGDFEMASDEASVRGYLSTVRSWVTGDLGVRMPGGETGHEFLDRYDADVERATTGGHDTVLLVSHGAAIRTWVASRVTDAAGRPEAVQPLHNTSLVTVEGHPRTGWRLLDWHAEPVGGAFLEDESAPDPTGEPTSDAR
ncbi:histidine phosphatase family protein [Nocardioides jishulii]|uniref:Histidine phosphatase family protein n=2 Tax=Nocardioides jishulii TaxID=2575440 RepID=A0A4U2YTX5_9ACTN|nr:histidine phosphatase family protein [Nocardioides jishulii]TKI64927.1 histidine phosphatase family protein [Nocardioides jishulii]